MIVDPDFCDHWKTRMLVGLLDGDEAAPVYVLRLWAHCQNRRQDRFPNLSPEALKALCRFPGDAAKLLAALVETGFVRRDGRDLVASNWSEYNASLIAAWKNGTRGGRPPKGPPNAPSEPTVYPEETHGLPTGKPMGSRLDESREEKIEERSPTPASERDDPPIVKKSKALKAALAFWSQYWTETHGEGRPESPTKIEGMLARAMSAGWSEEKIIESIRASVGWGAKSWRDPDVNFDEQAKSKANGRASRSAESAADPRGNFAAGAAWLASKEGAENGK